MNECAEPQKKITPRYNYLSISSMPTPVRVDQNKTQSCSLLKTCNACGYSLPKEEYSGNHWAKLEEDEFSRCKTCVKAGTFMVTESDPNLFWVGWPKCPVQVLEERGCYHAATGHEMSPEKIGEVILSMPDHKWLLDYFEIAGHYGYGGLNEGLCCMPGCVTDCDLRVCSHCHQARYCSVAHQALHWNLHNKDEDIEIDLGDDDDGADADMEDVVMAVEDFVMAGEQQLLVSSTSYVEQQQTHPPQSYKQGKQGVSHFSLVLPDDQELATKFSFAVLSQCGSTSFQESDRKGKRKGLTVGFAGFQCTHCHGAKRQGGRFFPSTVKTLADTKKTLLSIQNHLLKCNKCPHSVKAELLRLRQGHDFERKSQKCGSQKAFFVKIWDRLRDADAINVNLNGPASNLISILQSADIPQNRIISLNNDLSQNRPPSNHDTPIHSAEKIPQHRISSGCADVEVTRTPQLLSQPLSPRA